jgi:hypothetical protein
LVDCLEVMLGEDDSEVGVAEGGNAKADGGRFVSLSWVLAEEHAMVPPAMPTWMLGAKVSRWLTGACLVK